MTEMAHTDKPTVTKTEAIRLDRKVIHAFDVMETYTTEVWEILSEMRETLAFKHFGFKTWAEYLANRTAAYTHLKVTREQLVWTLYDDGHSQRDIAEKLDVHQETVRRDLKKRKTLPSNVTPITKGRDGKNYPRAQQRIRPRTQTEEIAFCGDGWDESYKFVTNWLGSMIGKTSNPTYQQLSQLEQLLRKSLSRVMKMREEWDKNNS